MNESCRALIPDSVHIPEGKLLLAFSGGSDSLFLLAVLSLIAKDRTEAVYVNHALRPRAELEKEMELNSKNARALGIPLSVVNLSEGEVSSLARARNIGVEAAARQLRYDSLRAAAREMGADYILTAHHREDQVETVLMRIISSSPFYAYQAIAVCDGMVYRPMLKVSKKEIMHFLSAAGLEYSEDSTNSDISYLRNNIRQHLLPLLSEEERACISRIAENVFLFRKRFQDIPYCAGFFASVDTEAFLSALPFQRESCLYRIFNFYDVPERVSRKTLDEIYTKAKEGKGQLECHGLYFYFNAGKMNIYPPQEDFAVVFNTLPLKAGRIVLKKVIPDDLTLNVDLSLLSRPAVLRSVREGDRIGLRDGERKVSNLLKAMRLPYAVVLEDRDGIVALFARFLGGRDRLSARFLSPSCNGTALAIEME